MDETTRGELERTALEVRKDVVRMTGLARSYGLASAFSVVDLLVFLYWRYMKIDHENQKAATNDRFVLSKGTAVSTLYACLARLGYFAREELWSYRRLGAMLQGYPDIRTPGIDAPGGMYGGGLGIAIGLSLGGSSDPAAARVFCLLGDGELQEGVVWESLYTAASNRLANLIMLIDCNEHTNAGPFAGLKQIAALSEKISAFGWDVAEVDGHDFTDMERVFAAIDDRERRPKAILARTVTGSGIENLPEAERGTSAPLSSDEVDHVLSLLESGRYAVKGQ